MSEGTQPGRYCRNCGTEIRPGMTFCVSCGAPVTPVAGGPGPSSPGFDLPGRMRSFLGDLRRSLRQSRDGLSGTFSGFGTDGIKRIPRRALNWFRDLSGVPKLVLVGLVSLVLLVVLSPVAMVVAVLLFGVSIIALMVRMAQKGSLRNWGMVAVGSVVLVFVFGGISGALYGVGFGGGSDVDYEVISEDVGPDGDGNYYNVVSSSNDLESLNLVAQEIQRELLETGQGAVTFFDSRAGAESANLDSMVGTAFLYQDETQARAAFPDNAGADLSSEEVERVVDVIAENGYVWTTVNGGEHLPTMPGFMYEDRNPGSATATASASATPSAGDGSYAAWMGSQRSTTAVFGITS